MKADTEKETTVETKIDPNIGKELKKLRVAKGIKQKHIASALGVSSSQLSLLESDLRTWKAEWIETYRRVVGG